MKEYDILGGQNIFWPLLHIFRGSRLPPRDLYAPASRTDVSHKFSCV